MANWVVPSLGSADSAQYPRYAVVPVSTPCIIDNDYMLNQSFCWQFVCEWGSELRGGGGYRSIYRNFLHLFLYTMCFRFSYFFLSVNLRLVYDVDVLKELPFFLHTMSSCNSQYHRWSGKRLDYTHLVMRRFSNQNWKHRWYILINHIFAQWPRAAVLLRLVFDCVVVTND